MSYTKTQVVSMALQLLGQKPVTTLVNQSDIVNSASAVYDFFLTPALTENSWRFSTTIVELARELFIITGFNAFPDYTFISVGHGMEIGTANAIVFYTTNTLPNTIPPLALNTTYYARAIDEDTFGVYETESNANNNIGRFVIVDSGLGAYFERIPLVTTWSYIYKLPDDFLKLIRIFPQTYDFEIFTNNQLYSNLAGSDQYPLHIEYVSRNALSTIPDVYWQYYVYKIANFLALSNAQYAAFVQPIRDDMNLYRAIAMAADAQNRPQTPIISQPIISNRSVTGLVGMNSG